MRNTFGEYIRVTLFGESHKSTVGAVLDGIGAGIPVNTESIRGALERRRGEADISTPRRENDEFEIISGVSSGYTEGSPIALLIKNEAARSEDYSKIASLPRPSHADYAASVRYGGYNDPRGGGHFSARLTAPIVALGAIVRDALENKGIYIGTHIKSIGNISADSFGDIRSDLDSLRNKIFPALDLGTEEKMKEEIRRAREEGDSVGGTLECAVVGMPIGIGEPWFDSAESVLSHALFSIPGVKGVEFGAGFEIAKMRGSQANDPFAVKDGKIVTEKNDAGGINGGLTNGMPIIIRLALRPTPSIAKAQRTADTEKMENAEISVSGRHDPCIVPRAAEVVNALVCIALSDILAARYGENFLSGKI